jgi:nucleotidyltransferase substrate binding protein (TIGR01987 family)
VKNKTLEGAISAFSSSLGKLQSSLEVLDETKENDEYHAVFEDAVIKRFEVAFEYCWKMIKTAVEFQGCEAFGPRPAIQEATRFGWLKDPEFWAEALDVRNGSVHDYFGVSRDEYVKIVRNFVKTSSKLKKEIEKVI